VGEVRAQLGLKSRDKRELKRFRSRLRDCCQSLGSNIEKLGPNSYRLKASGSASSKPAVTNTTLPEPQAQAQAQAQLTDAAARAVLKQRVGIAPRAAEATQRTRLPVRDAVRAPVALAADSGSGLGSRVSAWLARVRGRNTNTASTALSRLALDLQPNSSHFQYQWVDGDLRVKLTGLGARPRTADE
jgi:hypothetical protein